MILHSKSLSYAMRLRMKGPFHVIKQNQLLILREFCLMTTLPGLAGGLMMDGLLPIEGMANIAMYLSRHRKTSFIADHTMRPCDGER